MIQTMGSGHNTGRKIFITATANKAKKEGKNKET
jgi:hypothetical protein